MSDDLAPVPKVPRPAWLNWRRYTLRRMLVLTAICGVLFALWRGLLQGGQEGDAQSRERRFWVIVVVALPMLLLVAAGLIEPTRRLYRRASRWREARHGAGDKM